MTIDFDLIESKIESWFGDATGLDVEWVGSADTLKQRPYGEMDITAIRSIGIDENVTSYDPDQPAGRDIIRNTQGNRQFTLSLKVISRSRRSSEKAQYFIEKARTSLSKKSVQAFLREACLSIARTLPTEDGYTQYQDRLENWSMLDVIMNTVVNEQDPAEQGSFIESTIYSGTLTK